MKAILVSSDLCIKINTFKGTIPAALNDPLLDSKKTIFGPLSFLLWQEK
jgi:hypothetical protein